MPVKVPVYDQFVVSIGEVLWDVARNQRHIGGAPFNFAYHCQTLGAKATLISSVSRDELGDDLIEQAASLNMNTRGIQRFSEYKTGVVTAEMHGDGSVSYIFPDECAWDHIQLTGEGRSIVDSASVIYFGTLAQRSSVSRSAIMEAIARAPAQTTCFLDINLRPPYYSRELLAESLKSAHIVKMNEHELVEVAKLLKLSDKQEPAVRQLMEQFDVFTVVVTRGADGAIAWDMETSASVTGYKVAVADLIGCGDAFAAAFTINLTAGASLQTALEAANVVGAHVATHSGATPSYDPSDLPEHV